MSASKSPSRSLTVAAAAEAILRDRLEVFQQRLRQAARKKNAEDAESIHQLRVASRRGQAALELFSEQVSPKQQAWWVRVLRKARKAADSVRNLDVYAKRITADQDNGDVPPAVLKLIRRQRKDSLPKVVAVDHKWRQSKRLTKKQKKLLQGLCDAGSSDPTFRAFAAAALRPVRDAFLAEARLRDASPEQLHQLRIAGKHLRYTVELLREALPVKASEALLAALTRLQDGLGAINDHATAIELLADLAKQADDAPTKRWLNQQKRVERAALANAQAEFLQAWTLKERRRLQSLCEQALATKAKPKRPARRQASKRKRP